MQPLYSTVSDLEPEFIDLVEKYVNLHLPVMQSSIIQSFNDKNWVELKAVVHQLKGTAGGFGYMIVSKLAGKLEIQLASENYSEVASLIDELESLVPRIVAGLNSNQSSQEKNVGLGSKGD